MPLPLASGVVAPSGEHRVRFSGFPWDRLRLINRESVLWGVLVLLAVLLWTPHLLRSFWVDEAGTYWMAHEGAWAAVRKTQLWPGQSILYSWIASFFAVSGGPFRELLLRVPSILGMCAASWFLYRLAQRAIGRGAGILSVALFIFNPVSLEICSQARPYALALAAVSASLFALYAWIENRRRTDLLGYVIASALIVYLHYLFAVVFLVQAVYVFFVMAVDRRTHRWPELIAAWAAVALLVAPLIPYLRLLLHEAHTLPFSAPPSPADLTDWLLPSFASAGLLLSAFLVQWIAPGSMRKPVALARSLQVLLLLLWLAGPVMLWILSKRSAMHMFVPRYLTYSLLGQSLLLAYAGYTLFGAAAARVWILVAILLTTGAPSTIRAGSLAGFTELMPFMRVIRAESADGTPPVFFRSELPESDFYDWRAGLAPNSYLYAPFVAYPMSNRLLPLPYTLSADAKAHISEVIRTELPGVPKVLWISFRGLGQEWMTERMRAAGYQARSVTPNGFTVVVFER